MPDAFRDDDQAIGFDHRSEDARALGASDRGIVLAVALGYHRPLKTAPTAALDILLQDGLYRGLAQARFAQHLEDGRTGELFKRNHSRHGVAR